MRLFLMMILLMTSGCAAMEQSSFVSPSQALYHKADLHYENKEYLEAIELYEQYLEANPRSSLAPAASLNLGMSHYYSDDYKQAYFVLKEVNIKDENIKRYVSRIIDICKTKGADAIRAEEATQLAASGTTGNGDITISILDAYTDNFGNVVLKGKLNKNAVVTVGKKKINPSADNTFTASASWRKGNPILITAKDTSGSSGELNYFPDGERPDKPKNLRTINITTNSIEIEWDENDEDDIKGYRLFYGLQGSSKKEVQELIEDTQHEVIGLQTQAPGPNKTFEFFLRAVDKMDNESDDSDILEADLL